RPCASAWPFTLITELRRRRDEMDYSLAYMGAGIGFGLTVIGAGIGIGMLAAAIAEGVARQPSASAQITGAAYRPMFLLEGVAILAACFVPLNVLLTVAG